MKIPYEYAHSDELSAAYLRGYCAVFDQSLDRDDLKQMIENALWQAFRTGRDYENSDDERAEIVKAEITTLIQHCHRQIDDGNKRRP